MITVMSLWLPILVATVLVFLASWVINALLPYHKSDFGALPDEESARTTLRGVAPGQYIIPWGTQASMKDPAYMQKVKEGPLVVMRVRPEGAWNMGPALAAWFVYCLVVSIFAAYVASRAVTPEADYLAVFRFVGVTAFAAYVLAIWQETIWYGRTVSSTVKSSFDGLIYALLTAGTFGWLWPSM
jgi:flagellar biosynthesis protein FliQ